MARRLRRDLRRGSAVGPFLSAGNQDDADRGNYSHDAGGRRGDTRRRNCSGGGKKKISRRTVNEAKKNIAGIVSRKVGTKWMWSIPNEDCNIAEVSSDEE